MLFEEVLLIVGIPLILIVVGFLARRAELTIIGGIGLLVVGVMVITSPVVVNYGVNFTTEDSRYWNDTCLETVRVGAGDALQYYATSVTPANYTSVTGTLNNTYLNDNIYYTVRELGGTDFNITWNFSGLPNDDCTLTFNGHYDGGGGHYVKCTIYNTTLGAYQDCDGTPTNDFPNTVAHLDYTRSWSFSGVPEYYDDGVLSMRMQHVGGGSASHYMESDYLRMECIATTYTIGEAFVPCTHDSVNVTTTYEGVEIEENDNLFLGTPITFLGLLCLAVGALTLKG